MALLKTKLTNLLRTEAQSRGMELEFHLKNISINGVQKGCSGHVVNKANGSCVYVTTEESVYGPLQGRAMYRLAKDAKDYSSNGLANGYNRWIKFEDVAIAVVHLLATEKAEVRV